MSGEVDPALELAALVSALRAHAEYAAASGASGLPAAGVRTRHAPEPDDSEGAAQAEAPAAVEVRPVVSPGVLASAQGHEAPGEAQPGPEDLEQRMHRLAVLAEQVRGCRACVLHEQRTQTVFARGNGTSGLCFVGEGPGADEDAQGEPFVGKAGQLLDRMIGAMGFSRDEVYVCNIVKCRPPRNRKPEADEMAACRGFLEEQLALVRPQVIVALGATAVQGLLGTTGGITRLRGNWRLYKGEIAVMPTFHPAYLLRNPNAKRDVWDDLKEVLRHMGRPVPSRS